MIIRNDRAKAARGCVQGEPEIGVQPFLCSETSAFLRKMSLCTLRESIVSISANSTPRSVRNHGAYVSELTIPRPTQDLQNLMYWAGPDNLHS